MTGLTYGSVCSGIEAASVAWEPLGFWAEWFSEIEPFPAAVLAHRWPDVPNLGDMLALPALVAAGEIAAPDVLVGGTPCQAFSVAGNRESLADARGGLTLAYVELADAIDRQRARDGQDPCIVVWENVPGVLSTKDNAFGCFLAGLAGEDVPLLPPGKRWTNAGLVLGPKRAVAWRILDAQYFGLAQRRRRVFVVASARDGFDPSAVLLEFEGVRRDSAPSREAQQEIAGNAGPGAAVASADVSPSLLAKGNSSHRTDAEAYVAQPYQDVAHYLNAGGMGRIDYETESFVVNAAIPILEPGARTGTSTTDPRAGMGVGADGDPMYTLQAGKQHGVAFANRGHYGALVETDVSDPLRAKGGDTGYGGETLTCVSVTGDIAHTLNTANNGKGCSEDGTGRGVPTIAFSSKDYGADATEDVAPTLRAGGHADSHANAGVPPAVTVALRGREGGATAEVGGEVAAALRASTGGGDKPHVLSSMAVRRLVPEECELLQGFSPRHTLIPVKIKRKLDADELARLRSLSHEQMAEMFGVDPETFAGCTDEELQRLAADGPRYKAIGNSMAVPVMRWIGRRIVRHLNGEI